MEDISPILRRWQHDPKRNVRTFVGEDGREKIQVRISDGPWNGILQMDLEGRPDGKRPHDCDFALDFHRQELERQSEAQGGDAAFALDREDCAELFEEGLRVYERYVFLLGIQDYERVVRDTQRNMDLFRFVNRYAANEDDRMNLEKWWPYIIRINAVAKAMVATGKEKHDEALSIIDGALATIEGLEEVDAPEFHNERERARTHLAEIRETISQSAGKPRIEELRDRMREAVENEEFELAAELRDQIRALKQD